RLTIGQLADQAGTSTRVLRYYEEQGLLAPERTPGGQRRYDPDAAERVRQYRTLIDAGLGTRTLRELLPCMETQQASARAVHVVRQELERIRARARELSAAGDRLEQILGSVQQPSA